MKQRIFILGASGNVGRELVSQILQHDTSTHHSNPSEIIGVSNSRGYIFESQGISNKLLLNISESRENAEQVFSSNAKGFKSLNEIIDVVQESGLDGEVVFVDVTAGKEPLLEFHRNILLDTQNFLVTANKNPLSLSSYQAFRDLIRYSNRYDTNTTVMGGAGILNFVAERTTGIVDSISRIEGVFSGTLGYILSELESSDTPFSTIVRNAHELGYTEPNPWDDLNGIDVARKLIILARYAGYPVEMEDILIQPLIDEKYSNYVGEPFFEKLKQEDNRFEQEKNKAISNGEVLRYVAEFDASSKKPKLQVGLKSVPKNSDLGGLSGTLNLAKISTQILSEPLPHSIKSRGAGTQVTAGAVRVGIAKMLPHHIRVH